MIVRDRQSHLAVENLNDRQLGAYRVVEPLGEGGTASVYRAHQPAVARHVALKVLGRHLADNSEFLARFRHEALIVAQLQHPHILPVFDFGEADGYTFLAMPLVSGGTLASLLKGQPATCALTARVVAQVCAALDYAHSKGVIHRDIKPSNILIDEGGNCLVADFGIARLAEGITRLTMAGTVMGTPAYMSPEQVLGGEIGPRSDQYSFGIVLYEMVTGRVPFDAETPVAVAVQHVTIPPPPPRSLRPSVTPALEAVLLKALARDADDRFPSCAALAASFATTLQPTHVVPAVPVIVTPPARVPTHEVEPRIESESPSPVSSASSKSPRRVTWIAIPTAGIVFALAFLGWRLESSRVQPAVDSIQAVSAQPTLVASPSIEATTTIVNTPRESAIRGMPPSSVPSPTTTTQDSVRPRVDKPPVSVAASSGPSQPPTGAPARRLEAPAASLPPQIETKPKTTAMEPGPVFMFSPDFTIAGAVLATGTRVEFAAADLRDELLLLYQCKDQPCSSANQFRRWSASDFASGSQVVTVPSAARYYFWLLEPAPGRVQIDNGEKTQGNDGTSFRYTSGARVTVKTSAPAPSTDPSTTTPPAGPQITVTPTNGIALNTMFTVTGAGFPPSCAQIGIQVYEVASQNIQILLSRTSSDSSGNLTPYVIGTREAGSYYATATPWVPISCASFPDSNKAPFSVK
jgi:serine/threonine protein kinase